MKKMQNIPGIYKITCLINKRVYIGQSRKIKHRCQTHRSRLRNGKHKNYHLQNAWNKYGEKYFTFDVLCYCKINNLDKQELYFMDVYNTINNKCGFNLVYENTVLREHSIETKKKMSESHKGKMSWNKGVPNTAHQKIQNSVANSGVKNPFYGKTHTLETRKIMSLKNKIRARSTKELAAIKSYALKMRKPVQQLKGGKVVASFDGIREAERETGISSIHKVVKGHRKTAGSFGWRYKR